MNHRDSIAWAEAMDATGKTDAMGGPFTAWLVARTDSDGNVMRDEHDRQVFESQADCKARWSGEPLARTQPVIGQNLELFTCET